MQRVLHSSSNMLRVYLFQLLPTLSLAASLKPYPTASQKELVNFLNEGLNKKIDPCDDFYEFVCESHSSSGIGLLETSFQQHLLKLIRNDTKYPAVSKALLDFVDDCVRFNQNNTYKLQADKRYLESVFNATGNEAPNFLESLLKVIFPVPRFNGYGYFSPTELITAFLPAENYLAIWADPAHEYVSDNDFDEILVKVWHIYNNLTFNFNRTEYHILQTEEQSFTAFVDKFRSIVRRSNISLSEVVSLQNLRNRKLQEAIKRTVPVYFGIPVTTDLQISLDEALFDELNKLFVSRPRDGKHFILCMAISMAAFSTDLLPSEDKKESTPTVQKSCFYEALDPQTSGVLFNLYAANLLIRNKFEMTTIEDQLAVRSITELIRFQIRNSLIRASWLQNDREMLRDIDILLNISTLVGLPEEAYNNSQYSEVLNRFSGFHKDDNFIQKIIRLRSSNTQLVERAKVGTLDTYFQLNAFFSYPEQSIHLYYLILLAPLYSKEYPISYSFGSLGTTIGHEFFHRFSPPFYPTNWENYRGFKDAVKCYADFYDGLCYNTANVTKSGRIEKVKVCADGYNDIEENIPDIEGARAAFQAMKYSIGEKKLKERAMPQFSFTNEQMFFIGGAEFYCDKRLNNQEYFFASLQDKDDFHGAGIVRVNAVSMQMEEFQSAFSCKSTDRMVIEKNRMCQLLPSK